MKFLKLNYNGLLLYQNFFLDDKSSLLHTEKIKSKFRSKFDNV